METNTSPAAPRRVRPGVIASIAVLGLLIWLVVSATFAVIGAWGGPEQPDPVAPQAASPPPSAESVAPTPEPTVEQARPTPEPTIEAAAPDLEPIDDTEDFDEIELVVDPTNVLGMSPNARHGYVASRNAWVDPVPCASSAESALVGVDVENSTSDSIVLFDAGFPAAGSIQQVTFSAQGRAAALLSCGEAAEDPWLQILDFDDDGRVSVASAVFELPEQELASGPYLAGWEGESRVRVYVYPNGEWHELTVDAGTGDASPTQARSFDDDFVLPARRWTPTPDGQFTYREIDDPQGRPGCEGTGFATTIELDDGSGPRPAFSDPDQVFATVSDLHFGPDGLVAWRTSCEGFATPFVGRIGADGSIAGAHAIDVNASDTDTGASTEYRDFRLTTDGYLVGVGARYSSTDAPQIALFKSMLSD